MALRQLTLDGRGKPAVDRTFQGDYGLEFLVERLPSQPRPVYFRLNGTQSAGAPDEGFNRGVLTLLLTSPSAGDFVAMFEPGIGSESGPRGCVALPDRRTVAVVDQGAVYVIPIAEPTHGNVVAQGEVTQVALVDEVELVLLVEFTRIRAYGTAGQRWLGERLAWDDLRLLALSGNKLIAEGFEAPNNSMKTFTLDVATGASTDAPFPAAPD